MWNFKYWSCFLRLIFIAGLFTLFLIKFAWPSFKIYLNEGVIIEKSSARSQTEDSPSITCCVLSNRTDRGWRTEQLNESGKHWVDINCNSPDTVDDASAFLDNGTFNLNETILGSISPFLNFIPTNNKLWIGAVVD